MPESRSALRKIKRFADAETPLVKGEWYVAARRDELARGPVRRRILGMDMLILRGAGGRPAALSNRCPHRGYPLHLGDIDPEGVSCGYHGIRFALDGRCLGVPSQDRPPKGISVRTFPAIEFGPWIWVWTGDGPPQPGPEAPSLIGFVGEPLTGYLAIRANYIGLHENLIDLSSFSSLLKDLVGGSDYARSPIVLRTDARTVQVQRRLEGVRLPPFYASVLGDVGPASRISHSVFHSPALQSARSDIGLADGSRRGTLLLHAITPETDQRTHYFWAILRDFAPEAPSHSDRQAQVASAIFVRIGEALEQIAVNAGAEPDPAPIHLSTDQAGLELRHIIQNRAVAEQESRPAR